MRVYNRRRANAIAGRKDAKLAAVVISERYDKKAAKYATPQVPFPFDSRDTLRAQHPAAAGARLQHGRLLQANAWLSSPSASLIPLVNACSPLTAHAVCSVHHRLLAMCVCS